MLIQSLFISLISTIFYFIITYKDYDVYNTDKRNKDMLLLFITIFTSSMIVMKMLQTDEIIQDIGGKSEELSYSTKAPF